LGCEAWTVLLSIAVVIEPDEQLGTAAFFRAEIVERPFAKMRAQRMAFVDALVLNLAERTPNAEQFVTWNARHFRGKSPLTVLTPEEYVKQI